jgi:EmrB/QacA subfamily drug resistance transporter
MEPANGQSTSAHYQRRETAVDLRSRFRAAFFSVAPAMFLGSIDQTIVAAALPVIARSFGGLALTTWVVTGYLLAATVAAPIYGRLGDAFGRRRMLLWALGLFLVGSFICAIASSLMLLVIGRCLQGFGGGGLMTLAQALIGEVVSPKERGRYQGWFGAVFALASMIGPAAGGVMTHYIGWRSIFWINLPLSALAAAIASRLRPASVTGKFRTDSSGILLFTAGTVTLLLVFTVGGHELAWKSVELIMLLILSVLCFLFFCRIEHHSLDPLLPPHLLEKPVVWRSALAVLLFAAVLFGLIVQLPLFLQVEFGVGTTASGLLLIPLTVAQVVISTATGLRISSTGKPRNSMLFGLAGVSLLLFALVPMLHHGPFLVALLTLFVGAGLGSTMPAAQTMVQWAAGNQELGEATAVLSFSRSVGGVLGTAITSAVLVTAQPSQTRTSPSPHSPGFGWMFFALGILALAAALTTATLPNVDLTSKST